MRQRRAWYRLFALAGVLGCAAQVPWTVPAPPPPPPALVLSRPRLPEGSELVTRVDQTLATDQSKLGQSATATLETPVRDRSGRALLPRRTQLVLRIDRLERGKGAHPAHLEVTPIALRVPCGREQPIEARLSYVHVEEAPAAPDREPVRNAAVGGLLVGAMLFGIPGAAIGWGIAGSGGVSLAMARREVNAQLVAGTVLKIEIEEPVWLNSLSCSAGGYTGK